jgi:hypothetical protein
MTDLVGWPSEPSRTADNDTAHGVSPRKPHASVIPHGEQ